MAPEKIGEFTEDDLKSECVKDDLLNEVSGGEGGTCLAKPKEGAGADVFLNPKEDGGESDLLREGNGGEGDFLREEGRSTSDVWTEPKLPIQP